MRNVVLCMFVFLAASPRIHAQSTPESQPRIGLDDWPYEFRRLDKHAVTSSVIFGPGGKSNLLIDIHQMKSDGYQTYNFQRRNAFEAKYQYSISQKSKLMLRLMHAIRNSFEPRSGVRH